jgi:hypothetical protein
VQHVRYKDIVRIEYQYIDYGDYRTCVFLEVFDRENPDVKKYRFRKKNVRFIRVYFKPPTLILLISRADRNLLSDDIFHREWHGLPAELEQIITEKAAKTHLTGSIGSKL